MDALVRRRGEVPSRGPLFTRPLAAAAAGFALACAGASSTVARASPPAGTSSSLRHDDARWPSWPTALDDIPVILSDVDSSPEVAVAALERLRQAPESLAGAWVEQALVHPARAVVRAAADLCVDRGWTRCIAPAVGALDAATDLRTRTSLFRVLLLGVDARGVDRLESALRGALKDAVVAAAQALAATDQRMEKAHRDRLVLALAARARDEQAAIRAAVLPALARLAPGERAALMVAALADPVPAVRAACIEAMEISGHPRLLSPLVDALAVAPTAEVARALLGAISRNESPETEAVMLRLLTSRPRALAADDVEAALIARAPLTDVTTAALLELLDDPEAHVHAFRVLSAMPATAAPTPAEDPPGRGAAGAAQRRVALWTGAVRWIPESVSDLPPAAPRTPVSDARPEGHARPPAVSRRQQVTWIASMNPAAWTSDGVGRGAGETPGETRGHAPSAPKLRLTWADLRDARGPRGLFAALWVQALHPELGLDPTADPTPRAVGRGVLEGWARDEGRDVMSRCLSIWVLVQSAQGRRERATTARLLAELSRRDTSPESFRRCRALATGIHPTGTPPPTRATRAARAAPAARADRAAWSLDLVDPSPAVRASALLSAWIGERQALKPSLLRALTDDHAQVRALAAALLVADRRGLRPLPGRSLIDPRALSHGPHAGWIWARVPVRAPASEVVDDPLRTRVILPVPALPAMDVAWLPVGGATATASPLEVYQASQSWVDSR